MQRHSCSGTTLDTGPIPRHPRLEDGLAASRIRRFALFLLLSSSLLAAPSWARDMALSPAVELEALNKEFRTLYHQRTQQVLEALPLVLVIQNHTITAVRGTQRRLYPVPLQRYNEARAIVHATLGFHGLMGGLAHAGAGNADWTRVETFMRNLERTRLATASSALAGAEKTQAMRVLDILRRASSEALAARTIDEHAIADTLRRTEPLLVAMAESVGQAHAAAMLTVLQGIQADATEQEWKQVVAVVTGPVTPRRNNLETAIVASVLGKEHLGTRIFYSENIFSVDGALAYLQTLVGDRELSRHVFGAPQRMWEDLFAPVSRTLVEGDFYTELAR